MKNYKKFTKFNELFKYDKIYEYKQDRDFIDVFDEFIKEQKVKQIVNMPLGLEFENGYKYIFTPYENSVYIITPSNGVYAK